METAHVFTQVLFATTTLLTVRVFFRSGKNSLTVLITLALLMIALGIAGIQGFFRVTDTLPPRFLFLIGPGMLTILLLFLTHTGRRFIDRFDIQKLTLLHIVRVPVEITLYLLCTQQLIPKLMTFEGYNFDILSGISAPVMYYLVFIKRILSFRILLLWNFLCLGLLFTILTIAVLSVPTPFQQLAFDQPNRGVMEFPFVWLPGVVVPLVLFSHLAAIRNIMLKLRNDKVNV